jgi:hypothetical protein
VCYVQFPQRFDGIDRHDRYANRNVVFFDVRFSFPNMLSYRCCHYHRVGFLTFAICIIQINMKGLDGIQGPIYVGTGCVFRRQALYGYDAPKTKKPPSRTCNCWPKWCLSCCCSRNKNKKKNTKPKTEKKKRLFFKKAENPSPAYALGEIEEGAPGIANLSDITFDSTVKLQRRVLRFFENQDSAFCTTISYYLHTLTNCCFKGRKHLYFCLTLVNNISLFTRC